MFGSDIVNLKYKILLSTDLWRLGKFHAKVSNQKPMQKEESKKLNKNEGGDRNFKIRENNKLEE